MDGAGAGGDLDALAARVAAVREPAPLQGDFDAVTPSAAAVAALEPCEFSMI
jgi:hypothetical protein